MARAANAFPLLKPKRNSLSTVGESAGSHDAHFSDEIRTDVGLRKHAMVIPAVQDADAVTPGIKAPEASATVPPNVAFVVWAITPSKNKQHNSAETLKSFVMIPPLIR